MTDRSVHEALAHYDRGLERDRLDGALGSVEFERTVELLAEHLPEVPAVVADIGGGPGHYTVWLAGLGIASTTAT